MNLPVLAITGSMGSLLAALITAVPAAPVPTERPTLAFVSCKVRGGVIYLVTTDGKATCLDNDTAHKKYGSGAEPSWSPDGRQIAFTRPLLRTARDGVQMVHHGICVMDADGKNVKQRTGGPHDLQPAWSPDGKRIAFQSSRHFQGVICVMDADGTNVKELTKEQHCEFPVWSPDGKKIAFINMPPSGSPRRPQASEVATANGSRPSTRRQGGSFAWPTPMVPVWCD